MNELQKWLAEKEEKMPSENHPSSKLGLAVYQTKKKIAQVADSVSGKIRSKIAHQYNMLTNLSYKMDYCNNLRREKQEKEKSAELRAMGFEPDANYVTQWDKLDFEERQRIEATQGHKKFIERSFDSSCSRHSKYHGTLTSLIKAARDDSFALNYGMQGDNLQAEYDARKSKWQALGYDWDSKSDIKNKLKDIRKKAYGKIRKEMTDYFLGKIENGELCGHELCNGVLREELHCKHTGEKPELIDRVTQAHDEKAPFVYIKDFYSEHPQFRIAHAIKGDTSASTLVEKELFESRRNFRDFFEYLLKNKPSISCFGASPDTRQSKFYGPVGVLVSSGKIFNVSSEHDAGSIGFNNRLRLSGARGSRDRIKSSLDNLAKHFNRGDNGNWNEVIVGEPEIDGLFFVENTPGCRHCFVGYERTIQEAAQLALKYQLPFYRFKMGRGFEKVEARDYAKQDAVLIEVD